MTNRFSVAALGLLALAAAGCEDSLVVQNTNSPERERVFALPTSVEQILGSGYQLCRNTEKNSNMFAQLAVMSGESYSALNNFNMGPRDAIPRAPIQNSPAASQALYENFGGWSRQSRLLALAMVRLDSVRKAESDGAALATAALDTRARAVGFFNMGCTLGWLSLTYDSAGIVDHTDGNTENVPPLSGYLEVNAAALAYLDSAIAEASKTANGFPANALWFGGNAFSAAEFIRLARSFKARFRANVPRNKADAAAVNWAAVAADAEAGITSDFLVQVGGSTGWSIGLSSSQFHVSAAWAQLTMMYNGFADTSGTYEAWLQTPMLLRSPLNVNFTIRTPDTRWPQGATLDAQRAAASTGSGQPPSYTSLPYNRVRGEWSPGDPWGESWYSSFRYKYIRNNSNTGPYPDMLKAEMDLLAAEAYLRLGNMTQGLAKLNASRARYNLPAVTGTDMNTQITGSGCVPRVPQPPNYTTVACGSVFEALKYEMRMELAYGNLGGWFFPNRRWEDLVQGTPLFYPVPFEEMGARQRPFYNVGGGGYGTAPQGTYRF
ncbi:MAG: RagB/SusD family nutrient uptake outer membrane protein [Gemmatimonadaceae bacterium]|nr:RagB/SusD family nutrient uptake outer membrane protein [Gemmatimonadaceae bacterium]